jgi:hypothetical protein
MKVNIEYKWGKDIGKSNWRISISKSGSKITIKTENFELGFRDGEWWDSLFTTKNGGDTYENYVTVITKDKSKLETFKPLIIDKFYEILEYNMKYHQSEIKRLNAYVNNYKDCLVCDIFKDKIREGKLNELGI